MTMMQAMSCATTRDMRLGRQGPELAFVTFVTDSHSCGCVHAGFVPVDIAVHNKQYC